MNREFNFDVFIHSRYGEEGIVIDSEKKESKHDASSKNLYKKFHNFFLSLPETEFAPLKIMVPNAVGLLVLRFILVVAGMVTLAKKTLCNDVMIRWVKSWRLEKTRINSEFHQPSTTNRILRQFFGHMATYHDWKLRVANFF